MKDVGTVVVDLSGLEFSQVDISGSVIGDLLLSSTRVEHYLNIHDTEIRRQVDIGEGSDVGRIDFRSSCICYFRMIDSESSMRQGEKGKEPGWCQINSCKFVSLRIERSAMGRYIDLCKSEIGGSLLLAFTKGREPEYILAGMGRTAELIHMAAPTIPLYLAVFEDDAFLQQFQREHFPKLMAHLDRLK